MFKRRIAALLLTLALLAGSVAAAGYSPPPYAILVNRVMNTVTIYAPGNDGYYSVPVKAMICSTARQGHVTPLGRYSLISWRSEWRLMFDGTYGQYATGFYGNYLFHSICYTDDSHDAMKQESYNALGEAASMGCIRLETADAKWIFDNCPAGTPVVIYDDPASPGPLGKPSKTVEHITDEMYNGWDPTDPAEGNPWHAILAEAVTLDRQKATLTAGETVVLTATVKPETVSIGWASSDETVARVDETGTVTALKAGTAEIRAETASGTAAVCTVIVEGELLPFDDVKPGVWYYSELRQALADGLFQGTGERQFTPDGDMNRAMVVQVLYNLAGRPDISGFLMTDPVYMEGFEEPVADPQPIEYFQDVTKDAWYYDAVIWAAHEGVVNGVSETEFAPLRPITRQELLTLLWRRAGKPAPAAAAACEDAGRIEAYAKDACAWAAAEGFAWYTEGKLQPFMISPRAETAVIFDRVFRAGHLTKADG